MVKLTGNGSNTGHFYVFNTAKRIQLINHNFCPHTLFTKFHGYHVLGVIFIGETGRSFKTWKNEYARNFGSCYVRSYVANHDHKATSLTLTMLQ